MRLTDLNPGFVGHGGPGILTKDRQPIPFRHGVGIIFDCPCGCDQRCYVDFKNPIDGGPPVDDRGPFWQRSGETFETLTLAPSILRSKAKALLQAKHDFSLCCGFISIDNARQTAENGLRHVIAALERLEVKP